MLRRLKDVKTTVQLLQGWWTAETTVYVEPANRKPGENLYLRERLEDEYPENQRHYWLATVEQLDVLAEHVKDARWYALEQYNATLAQEAER
jgi:hypothetical protein